MAAPKPAPQSPQPSPPCSLTRAPIPSSPSMQLISTPQSSTNHGLTTVTGSTLAPYRRIFTTIPTSTISVVLHFPITIVPINPAHLQIILCITKIKPAITETKFSHGSYKPQSNPTELVLSLPSSHLQFSPLQSPNHHEITATQAHR
ncbi:hypothetical protein M0R45_009149 [Rubus argutus]|uniref:Uncharacterized protein n=1 Tax=Rubus argutus TaxID=59490 RepID=A0AAW1Y5P8_RUBAR